MTNKKLFTALISLHLLTFACARPGAEETPATEFHPVQWELPKFLREASGLAVASPEYLIAHNDEKGNLYRITLADQSVVKLASIGKPPIRKDFEGIAIADNRIFLATSTGEILIVTDLNLHTPGQIVPAKAISTGLGKLCEIEGLHYLEGALLLPCKNPLTKKHEGKLVVFSYSIDSGETSELFSIPKDEIPGLKKLRVTAIDATDSDYYIISANRLIVVDRNTLATRVFKLPKKTLQQVEGIAVLDDGSIVLVEDKSEGGSRLTIYSGLDALEEKRG